MFGQGCAATWIAPVAMPLGAKRAGGRNRRTTFIVTSTAAKADVAGVPAPPAAKPQTKKGVSLIDTTRRQLLTAGGTLAAFGVCPCATCGPAQAGEWSYGAYEGPRMWGAMCREGTAQSPININTSASPLRSAPDVRFQFNYASSVRSIANTGHGMQVNFNPGSIVTFGDKSLELLQYHFHTPSEHTIDGIHSSMEVHLVHKNTKTGGLCVLGCLMVAEETAKPHESFTQTFSKAPAAPGREIESPKFSPNVRSFLPNNLAFFNYKGSLTTPPCSEGVEWIVFTDTISVTPAQVLDFQNYLGDGVNYAMNYRPIQPLLGRTVNGFEPSRLGALAAAPQPGYSDML